MVTYYQDDCTALYCGDCHEILPALRTGSVDLVLTDPPYGDTSLHWDTPALLPHGQLKRLLKPNGSLWCFGSMRMFMSTDWSQWSLAQDIVWEKQNGSSFHSDRFKRVHEHALHFYDGEWRNVYKKPVTTPDATARTVRRKTRPPHMGHINVGHYTSEDGGPRLMRSVIYAKNCHGYAVHPTQKPVDVVSPLVEYSCPPGGVVLDPYCGSGTTLVVAKRLGMKAIGIEIDPKYCEAVASRLHQSLF